MDYRATLNLPQTRFSMRANLAQNEPQALKQWEKEGLYRRIQEATGDRPLYILHDGPPYANGHIHLGTAFNKVLKDIILKSKRLAGFHCPYVPGWDCHGLPIEHNVDKELGPKKREIGKLAFRGACRRYAEKWIKTQREEFKRLGVVGDWDQPYLTIDYRYEAGIAREFNRFLLAGSVVRNKKPVYWCSSCRTALAEAEVEYHDHASPSIYVKFPVEEDLGEVIPALAGRNGVHVIIWTTTPWTLPANQAVAFHPDYAYAAVETGGEIWILAESLVEKAFSEFGRRDYTVLATFSARGLEGRHARHPFMDRTSLMILASYVTLETGTGIVHTAPGHGREDYLSGLKYDLPILSPVDAEGRFTAEAGRYAGQGIFEANRVINDDLARQGLLVRQSTISHSYPHCWRCKNPVHFRATEQWFIAMDESGLRQRALAAIKEVAWVPRWGMERIYGMVEARPDWCLSRQRAWGVPLTVFYCRECNEVLRDETVAGRVVDFFSREGADAWFKRESRDFLGEAKCARCGSVEFEKEEDILDVWFDSGVSFAAVLEERPDLRCPADLYLEGSDQHRGWFQSSLLAAVGTRSVPPYRSVLTHGFVVDGQGKKMSKSLGNVIAPSEVIEKYGAEILRLWVASEDYRDDVKISEDILRQLADAYRKIRNTIRFLLGNLYDFTPGSHRVAYAELDELDQWALHEYELLKRKVTRAYDAFEFHTVFHGLYQFCTVTMSSLYLDVLKDRLYTSPAESAGRRAAQTVIFEVVDGLLRLMSPILSFTAAEAWAHLPAAADREELIFTARFPAHTDQYLRQELEAKWERLLSVRAEVTRALELARQNKVIGHSLEAEVRVAAAGELADFLAANWELLKTVTIVSDLRLSEEVGPDGYRSTELPGLNILVQPAPGAKCERCWVRSETVGADPGHPELCTRCSRVVSGPGR